MEHPNQESSDGEQRLRPGSWVRLHGMSSLPGRNMGGMTGIVGEIVFADVELPVDGARLLKVVSLSNSPLWFQHACMHHQPNWRSKCRPVVRTTGDERIGTLTVKERNLNKQAEYLQSSMNETRVYT